MSWKEIVGNVGSTQYSQRIQELKNKNIDTTAIEETVNKTITNLNIAQGRSFVIFGEPQSGKTEMMIALNARLLDEGHEIIINLLTDSLDLLGQSLDRFRSSGLSPSPKQFSELPDDPKDLRGNKWLIFSKKNARDLEKLITTLKHAKKIIVIDDEADYASPNAKINKDEKTKINKLICELLGVDGQYIGVTATPARLNLNNTFDNDTELWVDFLPHPKYVGQNFFFPADGKVDYRLNTFKADEGSEKVELQKAILHFLCGVAEQHLMGHKEYFTMLVHTSGKKEEHQEDIQVIRSTIATLSNTEHKNFLSLLDRLSEVASLYTKGNPDEIKNFVLKNINRNMIVEINSRNSSGTVSQIAKPTSLFSFGAGGNIISRGVTFDNLLSMYFTRSVKGKFSQDTYIQRARMFGSREKYKKFFQLWIPDSLMINWSKCFSYHRLALQAMRSKEGPPVWLSDHKTVPTSPGSIDRSTVDFEGGEMSFGLFTFDNTHHPILFKREGRTDKEMLEQLRSSFSDEEFPTYLYDYLKTQLSSGSISFHNPGYFGARSKSYSEEEKRMIQRARSIFGNSEFTKSENPSAVHHLKIYHNAYGNARLFYKINGTSITFIRNLK